jgi:hypothetical protein
VARPRARRPPPAHRSAGPAEARFEITGELDDYGAAELRLEIEEMARRLGATITTFQLEKAERAERSH